MSSALTLEASPSEGHGNLPLRSLPRWSQTLPSPTSSTFTDLLSAEQKQYAVPGTPPPTSASRPGMPILKSVAPG